MASKADQEASVTAKEIDLDECFEQRESLQDSNRTPENELAGEQSSADEADEGDDVPVPLRQSGSRFTVHTLTSPKGSLNASPARPPRKSLAPPQPVVPPAVDSPDLESPAVNKLEAMFVAPRPKLNVDTADTVNGGLRRRASERSAVSIADLLPALTGGPDEAQQLQDLFDQPPPQANDGPKMVEEVPSTQLYQIGQTHTDRYHKLLASDTLTLARRRRSRQNWTKVNTIGLKATKKIHDAEEGRQTSRAETRIQFRSGVFLVLFGAAVALIDFGIDQAIRQLLMLRVWFSFLPSQYAAQYTLFVLFTVAGAWISIFLVRHFAPLAGGSGLPVLKSLLSTGAEVDGFLDLRTLVVKILGIILALGSGLFLGNNARATVNSLS